VTSIDTEFLSGIDRNKQKLVPKLTLNLDDNELFNQIMTSPPDGPELLPQRASHERLLLARAEAKKQVKHIVAPFDEKEHGIERLNPSASQAEAGVISARLGRLVCWLAQSRAELVGDLKGKARGFSALRCPTVKRLAERVSARC
jgi:hypothetical protein